jgi:hypothetical protein
MQEHSYLLFHTSMDAIRQEVSTAKKVTKMEEGCLSHPKEVHTMHII